MAARQSTERRELMRDESLLGWIDPHLSPQVLEGCPRFILINEFPRGLG